MAITIQVDSRENKNEHVLNQLKELGCNFVNSKLYVGDYTLLHKQDICKPDSLFCYQEFEL